MVTTVDEESVVVVVNDEGIGIDDEVVDDEVVVDTRWGRFGLLELVCILSSYLRTALAMSETFSKDGAREIVPSNVCAAFMKPY